MNYKTIREIICQRDSRPLSPPPETIPVLITQNVQHAYYFI